jgi:hypothetical protein
MSEHSADLERELGSSLRRYADRPELHWVPSAVVADVVNRRRPSRWRRGWLLSASAAVIVVLAVGVGLWAFRPSLQESYPAAVSVGGLEYLVGIGRGLSVSQADLAPFGVIEQIPNGLGLDQFADPIAYTLDGVDPREALVARTAPGLGDDAGPYGKWFILWGPGALRGPHSAALCGYFDLAHPAMREIECEPPIAATPVVTSSAGAPSSTSSAFAGGPTIGGANSTPLDLAITINGIAVASLPRSSSIGLLTLSETLPALPWLVEARTTTGRALATLEVPTQYVPRTFVRSDLSCGAVMLFVGPEPVSGPAPPYYGPGESPGTPGDCDP